MTTKAGLSILIPVYNYDVRGLIQQLHEQLIQLTIPAEILCFDDASPDESCKDVNREIINLPHVRYNELPVNLGRAAIRNKLASEADFQKLLFIDCDSELVNDNFVKNYLTYSANYLALAGGTIYEETNNTPQYSLRWTYGRAREQKTAEERNKTPYESLTINNFLIDKDIFLGIKLDEGIEGYGHEDTKFGYALHNSNITLYHISNPVIHCGLESNEVFLKKTETAIKNFYKLSQQGYGKETSLYKSFSLLNKYHLKKLFLFIYELVGNYIQKKLCSPSPSLLLFDLYKLKLLLLEDKK